MTSFKESEDLIHRLNSKLLWWATSGFDNLFIAIYRQEFRWLKEMNE